MKRLSDEEAQDVDTDPAAGDQAQQQTAPQPTQTAEPQGGDGQSPGMSNIFPEGTNVLEGEIPDSMLGPQEATGEGAEGEGAEGEGAEGEGQDPTPGQGDSPEAEGEGGEEAPEQADDVATSATLDKVRKQAGLNVESDDELVDTVKDMRRDLEGTQEFRNLFDEVPELGEVVSGMFDAAGDDGEIDTVSFLMSLEQVPGVQVSVPDPAEAPDEHDDFRLNLRERRRKLQEQRQQQNEMEQKQQEIVNDYERAFDGFKDRKDLGDKEAEEFKDWFRKTFYGDYERGVLPRDDIFDMAYEHYADDGEETPVEETEEYQKGYNQAIEEMKQKGAGDGVPNMMSSGSGSNAESPDTGSSAENDAMAALYSEEELRGPGQSMHEQF